MSFSDLVAGEMVVVNGVRMLYAGPVHNGFAFIKRSLDKVSYAWNVLQDQVYAHCSQSWEDEPTEGRLATEEDVGNVVYDEHGDACLLVGVNCGPLKQCVISYGGDTLGWTSKCHVPSDQATADAEYEKNETDEMVGDAPCCQGNQGACQGGASPFSELAKILGVRFVTK